MHLSSLEKELLFRTCSIYKPYATRGITKTKLDDVSQWIKSEKTHHFGVTAEVERCLGLLFTNNILKHCSYWKNDACV